MTALGPLFGEKRPAHDGGSPPATIAALQEIACEGKRAWIESIISAAIERGRGVEDIRESLGHERLPADLVARLVIPLRGEGEKDGDHAA